MEPIAAEYFVVHRTNVSGEPGYHPGLMAEMVGDWVPDILDSIRYASREAAEIAAERLRSEDRALQKPGALEVVHVCVSIEMHAMKLPTRTA